MKSYLAALLLAPTLAFAQIPPPALTTTQGQQTLATVTSVAPIYENVVVGRNCQQVPVYVQPQSSGVGEVVGGVLGAVVGSRFGGGHGRDVATVAGAIGGTMIGGRYENSHGQIVMAQPEVRCTPITQLRATAVSYVAEYNGIKFSGVTYRPIGVGDKVYVNVVTSINPLE